MIDLAKLEAQKTGIVAVVEGWPQARLAHQPTPADWSAAQVFDHLVRTEIEILAATRKGMANPHRIGLRDRLGYTFVERVFATDRRVKVPGAATVVLPEAEPDLDAVLARWNASRQDLAAFVGSLSPEQRAIGIFRHPVCGWMDIARILGFFSIHIVHHHFQLKRLATETEHLA